MTEKKSNILKNNGVQIKKGEIDQYLNTDFKKNIENQH
jgi:predicted adenine nucleotide alpha hydrolase (AANH) superfamily ATPase